VAHAKLGKHAEPVAIGQVQVEEDEAEVGMLLDEPHSLAVVGGFQDGYVARQLLENAPQCLSDRDVMINH
jgi:hypothetical protein